MPDWLTYVEQFHFLRPLWLLAIVPAVLVALLLWRQKPSYGLWEQVISPHLLPHLLSVNSGQQSKLPVVLLMLGWFLASIAMAGPTWKQLPQPVQEKIDAQVILLDLSLSMYAKDLSPSRLVRARLKLNDILNQTHEGLTALIVYAGSTHIVTPLTDDTNTIISMVNSLSPEIMPVKGSDPIAAVQRALDLLQQGGFDSGRILLMTDDIPSDFSRTLKPELPSAVSLSILGMGTSAGAPIELPDGSFVKTANGTIVIPKLDIPSLKLAAQELGGRFSTLSTSDDDINYLLNKHDFIENPELRDTDRQFDSWDETGHWLVLFILPLAAAAYRKGWLGSWLMALTLSGFAIIPRPSMALGWNDLWQTQDQQAAQLFTDNKIEQAAETFNNPSWKGYSYYQAQDYEKAERFFGEQLEKDQQNANGYYNLGNAQAQLQKFDDAITSYEKALELNPDLEDAKANIELLKQLQEQEKQQQESEDKKEQQDSKNQQDQESQQGQSNSEDQEGKEDEQNQGDQSQQDEQQQQSDEQNSSQDQANANEEETQSDQEQQADKEQAQKPDQDKPAEEDENAAAASVDQQQGERSEDQEAMEQWLRRIPDDPGGLLRRKFLKESQNRQQYSSGEKQW